MIYFRGCLSREKLKEIPQATQKLLEIANINYEVLEKKDAVVLCFFALVLWRMP